MIQRAHVFAVVLILAACGPFSALASGEPADASITRSVADAIVAEPSLRAMDIHVNTHEGIVRLTGFVRSLDDIMRAAGIARDVQGVSGVRNHLRVADRPSRA
jgi:osmotically-inducible protein OsmY